MRKYSIIFFIKQSLNGLFKNGASSLTSAFILTSCLVLMGCFGFLTYNVDINLEQMNELNQIIFYIGEDYKSEEEIERIKQEISELANVKQIRHKTSAEALDEIWEEYFGFEIFEEGDLYSRIAEEDVLSESIEIEYTDAAERSTLIFLLKSIKGYEDHRDVAEIADFIADLRNGAMLLLGWFLALLFGIAIFIVLNTVRLSVHSRRDEIIIMRYIGATNFFILFPFLLEGIIIGVVSAVAAYFIQLYIYVSVVGWLGDIIPGLLFIDFGEVGALVFIIFVSVGVLCGLLGSSISSRRHLQA